MVSWESQSQQISQTDFIEWTFVRRSVTSLVLMGCAPGVCGEQCSTRERLGQPGAAMGGQSTDRQGTKEAVKKMLGGFVKASQNNRVRRKGWLDRL